MYEKLIDATLMRLKLGCGKLCGFKIAVLFIDVKLANNLFK